MIIKLKKLLLVSFGVYSFCYNGYSQDTIQVENLEVCRNFNKKGQLHGDYWHYDHDTEKEAKGNYVSGKREGIWTWEDSLSYGYITAKFKGGLLNGRYTKYDSNGDPILIGSYKKGLKHGKFTEYHLDNYGEMVSVKSIGSYKDGLKTGRWLEFSDDLDHLVFLFEENYPRLKSSLSVERTTYHYREGKLQKDVYHELGEFGYNNKFKSKVWMLEGQFTDDKKTGIWTFRDILSEESFGTSIATVNYKDAKISGNWVVKKTPNYRALVVNESFLEGEVPFKIIEINGAYTEGILNNCIKTGVWHNYDHKGNLTSFFNHTEYSNTISGVKAHIVISDLLLNKVDFIDVDSSSNRALFATKSLNRDVKYWIYNLASKKMITSGRINLKDGSVSDINISRNGLDELIIYDAMNDLQYSMDYLDGIFEVLDYDTGDEFYLTKNKNIKALGLKSIEDVGVTDQIWETIDKQSHFGNEFNFTTSSGKNYNLDLSTAQLVTSKKYEGLGKNKQEASIRSVRNCSDVQLSFLSEQESTFVPTNLIEDVEVDRNYFFGLAFYLTPEKTRFHYVDSAKASYTNRTDLVGTINFWNNDFFQKAKRVVKFNVTPEGKAIFYSNDGYYFAAKGLNNVIYFELEHKLYPFEQFDLKYNRPDIILDRLGYADTSLVNAYYSAYQKRLKKMRFTEDMLEDDFHLPEIKIKNFEEMPSLYEQGSINLKLNLKDSKYKLDRINVWVNDVAIYGTNGISLRDKNVQEYTTDLEVFLAKGNNKVQVSVLNQAGAESYKETFEVECSVGKNTPDLYLITIGVSEFEQTDFNLNYAAKDAQDISTIFKKSKAYNNVFTKTLLNQNVTKKNVLALKSFFAKAGINDEVMIFVAGHGVLDANLDYYLATYDIDFQTPSQRGLAYDDLEDLLDGIKPLKKTLIIDACHSGEIDKEEIELAKVETKEGDDIQFRAVGNSLKTKLGIQNTSELVKSLFTDLRKGSGATVISSAGGMEFAMEGDDWSNGLFTYCLIKGLKSGDADLNNDGEIWLSEIQEYVAEQVTKLSNGQQQPTSRIENQTVDIRVW